MIKKVLLFLLVLAGCKQFLPAQPEEEFLAIGDIVLTSTPVFMSINLEKDKK